MGLLSSTEQNYILWQNNSVKKNVNSATQSVKKIPEKSLKTGETQVKMGLLTDPSAGQGKLTKALLKYYIKLCILLYVGGAAWFCTLPYPTMNASTYFSENALLPGLVHHQFNDDKTAQRYYDELIDEMKKEPNLMPYSWLLAKFRQIGLDTYTHNFTLNSPLKHAEKYQGKNVYAILRAARASSTEALILSTPFRNSLSVHPPTAPSIALMLTFAKYANKEKFWAKDIIFLITEHDQLGVQAWLEAYHGVTCGSEGTLLSGDLRGRAGSIQAAINLELHDTKIGQIDIKIEGLNGQLPNLDLFNLAAKMCQKEEVPYTFKNKSIAYPKDPFKKWQTYFKTLFSMMSTQATGIPNGNHGLFHRFGIQALTLEGFWASRTRNNNKVGFFNIGRVIEGIFRSLNNLLERFHQSYFFYLLSAPDRYISIGLYMPAVCLMAGALMVKACAIWCQLQSKPNNIEESPKKKVTKLDEDNNGQAVILLFFITHLIGVGIANSPNFLTKMAEHFNVKSTQLIFGTLSGLCGILLLLPVLVTFRKCEKSMKVLNMLALLELSSVLICISMNNFSLALFCAIIMVPVALFVNVAKCKYYLYCQRLVWLCVHPLVVLGVIILINTFLVFDGEAIQVNFLRSIEATQQAIIYSIVDSMIYGNWLFTVVTSILIPNWLCFWSITFCTIKWDNSSKKRN